ncbi:MAG: hypothetical protein ACPGSO_07570 [Vicingaceae bacterium]
MKKLHHLISLVLLVTILSCSENKSHFEQMQKEQPFTSRILSLNKTIEDVRLIEKGELVKEDLSFLSFLYKIGKNDTYEVSYLFDEKGCYEIGIDGYFSLEKDAVNVVEGIQKEMNSSEFIENGNDNSLYRWINKDESVAIELDYKDTARGLFVVTIFANE